MEDKKLVYALMEVSLKLVKTRYRKIERAKKFVYMLIVYIKD